MDPRRRKAVVFAALTPALGAAGIPLGLHVQGHLHKSFIVGWILLMILPLALSLKEISSLKRDGNPY